MLRTSHVAVSRSGLDIGSGILVVKLDQAEEFGQNSAKRGIAANNDPAIEAEQLPKTLQQVTAFLTADQVNVFAQYTRLLLFPAMTAVGGGGAGAVPTQPRN